MEKSRDIYDKISKLRGEEVGKAIGDIRRELCRRSSEYFIENYVKIEDRDTEGTVIPFKLWDKQKSILKAFEKERKVQVLKANQLGLTWLGLAYICHELLFKGGYSVKAISQTEVKAKELVRRIGFILRYLPKFMISEDKESDVWWEGTVLSIIIHHKGKEDSTFQAFASSPTAGASFTANLFFFDEWALQEYAREIWEYAFPTINRESGGKVIGISTIERGSLFEDIWKADNDFVKIFLSWDSDPRRTREWYENTIKHIGLDETRKHYPATVEEAFAIPGGKFFDEFREGVHTIDDPGEVPDWYVRFVSIDYGLDCLAVYWYYVDAEGFKTIYREVWETGLIISEAVNIIKQKTGKEVISDYFAPDDLFSRDKNGLSVYDGFLDAGITLTRVTNRKEIGCLALKEDLKLEETRNIHTGERIVKPRLTIIKDRAPHLIEALNNIQKDKNNPKIYSDTPHTLTHSISSVQYQAVTKYSLRSVEPTKEEPMIRYIPVVMDWRSKF